MLGKLDIYPYRMKQDLCLSLCTIINSKWIKDINVRPEDLKASEETLKNIGVGNRILPTVSQMGPMELKASVEQKKISFWEYTEYKFFANLMSHR